MLFYCEQPLIDRFVISDRKMATMPSFHWYQSFVIKKQGLSHFLNILCNKWGWSSDLCTSREIKSQGSCRNFYEVNVQAVMGCREVGIGQKGLVTFCNIMNIPQPMKYLVYENINSKLYISYSEVAGELMLKAADEIGQHTLGDNFSNDAIANIKVSWDAAWERRGFASLNGICALISGGKVIDTEVLTKYCHSCNLWEHKKDSSN